MADVIDAHLHLLDRQILDRDEIAVGKVDDLEIELREGAELPVVTAILSGPMALGPRLKGRLGVWLVAVGRRMRPRGDNTPIRIGWGTVQDVGPVVKLAVPVADTGANRLEAWCREKVVLRLPWGDRDEDGS